jgi:MYXO-CTERM domain-containing protein
VKTVSVKVSPMGLQTSSSAPPFSWTLTRITGQQTITVTATDASGKSSSASVVVNAPGSDGGVADAGATDGKATDAKTMVAGDAGGDGGTAEVDGGQAGGCAIAGGPGTGLVASAAAALALLLAWAHRRRSVAQRVRPRRTDRRA